MMVHLIHFTHWAVLGFVLTAWAWPFAWTLWLHVFFVPLMILHWKTNRNRCFLSQLEEKYKSPLSSTKDKLPVEVEESQFIKMIFKKFFGIVPSDKALEKIIYALIIFVWILSMVRLNFTDQTS